MKDHKYPELNSQSSYVLISNFDDFIGIYCLTVFLSIEPVTHLLQYSDRYVQILKCFVQIGNNRIYFEKLWRALVCVFAVTVTEVNKFADRFKSVHRNNRTRQVLSK
jgi:hypothetical protein